MNRFGLRFHHVGLAVAQPERSSRLLAELGYMVGETVHDPEQKVHIAMCTHTSMPDVEMIWPAEATGPLHNLLKQQTELVYHLAYLCESVGEAVRLMREGGHRVIALTPERPAVLFGGRRVAFFRVAGLGMIELIEAGPGGAES